MLYRYRPLFETGDYPFSDNILKDLLPDTQSLIPDQAYDLKDYSERLAQLLGHLNERHGLVLRLRYGLGDESPKSLKEVSKLLGVSCERTRQIQKEALQKLRYLIAEVI